jgi:hypothetical protein
MNFTNKRKSCELQNLLQKPRPTRSIQGELLEPFWLGYFLLIYKDFKFFRLLQYENKDSFDFAGNQPSPLG